MSLLLTLPFTDELIPFDPDMSWAILMERVLREERYRSQFGVEVVEVSLVEEIHAEPVRSIESAPTLLLEPGPA